MPPTRIPRLYLLRRAKSSWDDPSRPDSERPLALRGERAAALMGEHLQASGIEPGLVLCSPAVRARQTLDGLGVARDARVEPGLYGAAEGDLLQRLRTLPTILESALLIGHNPALEELTLMLAGQGSELRKV